MAPGLTSEVSADVLPLHNGKHAAKSYPQPLKTSGALEKFRFEETTPAIGREFLDVNLVDDLLHASNADDLLRDLAITSCVLV